MKNWRYKYDWVGDFSDGLAVVRKYEQYGYVSENGQELIPRIFDNAWPFSGGIGVVLKDQVFGYVNLDGRVFWDQIGKPPATPPESPKADGMLELAGYLLKAIENGKDLATIQGILETVVFMRGKI